jgi:hypothetical protein
MKQFSTFLFLCLSIPIMAQISFTNANNRLETSDFHSGVAIAIADMNNDGLDDIVRLSDSRILNIEVQSAGNQLFQNKLVDQVSNQSQWSICVADVDNDGYNDVMCGGSYDGVKLIKAKNNGAAYELSNLPEDFLFMQASNFVDINNDGFVDYFACHDDAESRIWANDGTGNFVPADDWIDMSTSPASDNSGNYGSIWTDFDNDGDIDLYIAKCRQGVNNPSDPRRINALFVNDGAGNFSEKAEGYNLKIGAQSWTADFQDIDNDGDYDCFITNHDVESMLLENDGSGVFTDITEGSGIAVGGLPIQGVMRDFDNDGFVDILVAGTRHYLFHNNGDKTFTEVEGLFDQNDIESYAIGDLNHDGFLDIYGGYAEIYTNPSNIDDVVWLNDAQSGHNFLAVRLTGQESNRNGIGARIEIYGEWGIQVREVRSGESYGIMNSMTQHFGLGSAQAVDSLIVRWPSGQVDEYTELAANQFVSLIEGQCISPEATVSVDGSPVFCTGDSVLLTAPAGYDYLWSTGETTQSIWAANEGGYTAIVSSEEDCYSNTPMVEVSFNPDETPAIYTQGDAVFCTGNSVILSTDEAASYTWSTGANSQSIEVSESGEYQVSIQGLCEEFTSASVIVEVLTSDTPELVDFEETLTDSVIFTVSGSNVYWFEEEEGTIPFAFGNTVTVPIDLNTSQATAFVENREIYAGTTSFTGMPEHEGNPYSGNQYNGSVIFDCFSPFTLREVSVITDTPGPRRIQLVDEQGAVLQTREVVISEGFNILTLDFDVEPGVNLSLTTEESFNLSNFGFEGPRLRRADDNVQYPYIVDGVVQINNSNFGTTRYYYFFDWKIQEPSFECISDREIVSLGINNTEHSSLINSSLEVFPNPTNGQLTIVLPLREVATYQLNLINNQGQVVRTKLLRDLNGQWEWSTNDLPAGLYMIQLQHESSLYTTKVVIK